MNTHEIGERSGVAVDPHTAGGPRGSCLPDYLERALWDASRDASARSRPARVYARFEAWWDATMIDEIAQTTLGEAARTPEWWADKFQELRALATRETPLEGFEL